MKKHFFLFSVILVMAISCLTFTRYKETTIKLSNTLALLNEEDNVVDEIEKTYNNKEIVGLLEIPNTEYKTVITQSSDNKKYLNHDAYGYKNKIGNPFLDYRVNIDNDKKLLIYAHNSRYIEMPFKILENYYDEDYYKEHQYIKITTDEKIKTYQIFSVYVETSNWDYMNIKFDSEEDWTSHLEKLKNNSFYDTGVSIDKDDEILILQTCSTKKEYRKLAKKFLLVISRRVD